jgi:hypothetical protein
MSSPESTPGTEGTPEFDLGSAKSIVVELGKAAVLAGEANAFSLFLGSTSRDIARHDEEKYGFKTTGNNPFKNLENKEK